MQNEDAQRPRSKHTYQTGEAMTQEKSSMKRSVTTVGSTRSEDELQHGNGEQLEEKQQASADEGVARNHGSYFQNGSKLLLPA